MSFADSDILNGARIALTVFADNQGRGMSAGFTLLAAVYLAGLFIGGACLRRVECWLVGREATRVRLDVLRISRRIGRG